jgi:hypothetical protein
MGRRLTQVDMAAARYEEEVFNSRLKRGEVKEADEIRRTFHVICGCGVEGCMFMSHIRERDDQSNTPNPTF